MFKNCERKSNKYIKFKKFLKLKDLINDNDNTINYFKNKLL